MYQELKSFDNLAIYAKKLVNKIYFHNSLFHYDREWYYYTLYSQYDYLERLSRSVLLAKEKVHSDVTIGFGINLDFGLSSNQIIEKLGRPYFKYKKKEVKNYSIYFYKKRIYKHRINLEIHLINDVFFLGVYIFNRQSEEFNNIVTELCLKYKIDPLSFKFDEHQIADSKMNIIDLDIKSNLVIAYIDSSNDHIASFHRKLNLNKEVIERNKNVEKIKFISFL